MHIVLKTMCINSLGVGLFALPQVVKESDFMTCFMY